MKTLKTGISIWFIMLISIHIQAQQAVSAQVSYGRNYSDCVHPGSFMCTVNTQAKATANAQFTYDKKTSELQMVLLKSKTKSQDITMLKTTELQKGFYLYELTQDFVLPADLLQKLGIKNKTKIKKGKYLVQEKKDYLIIVYKLE